MLMAPGFVEMQVRMKFNKQKDDTNHEHDCRHSMHSSERLSQHKDG